MTQRYQYALKMHVFIHNHHQAAKGRVSVSSASFLSSLTFVSSGKGLHSFQRERESDHQASHCSSVEERFLIIWESLGLFLGKGV